VPGSAGAENGKCGVEGAENGGIRRAGPRLPINFHDFHVVDSSDTPSFNE